MGISLTTSCVFRLFLKVTGPHTESVAPSFTYCFASSLLPEKQCSSSPQPPPEKEIKLAIAGLVSEDVLVESDGGYLLKEDAETLKTYTAPEFHSVYALHRNDPLYKAFEPALKSLAKSLTEGLPYDCDSLQYLLIDGVFHGAVVGHFRNGPYDLNDVRIDDASLLSRKEEIIAAVQTVNFGALPQRFMGEKP